jgi:TPR repeat protein
MINCRRGLIAGVLFLTVALTPIAAVSGPFEDGQEAYKSGDYETALKLWRPLAEKGFANALQNLGIMYAWGTGVPQDYVQAHMWFNLAVSRSRPGEPYNTAAELRDAFADLMTPAQIAEAQKLARQWYKRRKRKWLPLGEQAE